MKKILLFLVAVTAIVFLPTLLFAQDTTSAIGGLDSNTDIFNYLFQFIPQKTKSEVIGVLTGLYLLEQFLAKTQKIAANSTFQLVEHWIKMLFKSLTAKKPQ